MLAKSKKQLKLLCTKNSKFLRVRRISLDILLTGRSKRSMIDNRSDEDESAEKHRAANFLNSV